MNEISPPARANPPVPRPLPVVFLPGAVTPVALSYKPLLEVLQDEAQPTLRELELYSGDSPPSGYRLDLEIDALEAAVEQAGLESFHLVGYSAGGAVALAFTARHPEKLRSLALIEPAWIGNQNWTPDEEVYWGEMDAALKVPPEKRMEAFVRLNAGAGQPSPIYQDPPPPWMATRPAGLEALAKAFRAYNLAPKRFRHFQKPVYLAVGGLSHPAEKRKAERLGSLFPDMRLEVYEGCHHLDPPHRAEPQRFALALHELWGRAEATLAIDR